MSRPSFPEHLGTASSPRVQAVLTKGTPRPRAMSVARVMGKLLAAKVTRRPLSETLTPSDMKEMAMAVPRDTGALLYLTARAIGARNIVEFGTSFGISTLYLAAAVRDNGGGRVTGTEIETSKAAIARQNLMDAGLDDVTDVLVGDALTTLADGAGPIDYVFLDGWKDLYLPVLRLLEPRLRSGAIVLADNLYTFPADLAEYAAYLARPQSGYVTRVLPVGEGISWATRVVGRE